jgi:hypothetical protein
MSVIALKAWHARGHRDFLPLLQRLMKDQGLAAAAIRGIMG